MSFSRGSSQSRDITYISCIGRRILYRGATRDAHARDDKDFNQRLDNEVCMLVYSLCFRNRTSNLSLNLLRVREELKTLFCALFF